MHGLKLFLMDMQQYLNSVFSLLEQEIKQKRRNLGLYNGLAGHAITCFLLKKHTGNQRFAKIGNQLLDFIAEQIVEVNASDFATGLVGIGWAIEWLKQNDLIDINTDEVLEEVDDIIYKTVVGASINDISMEKGVVGKAAYFLRRYQSQNPGTHRFRSISHQECLVILTDNLKVRICDENWLFAKSVNIADWVIAAQVLLFLGDLWPHMLNLETVELTVYHLTEHAVQQLERYSTTERVTTYTAEELNHFQYLAYALYWIGKQMSCRYWRERALSYSELLLAGRDQKQDLIGLETYALLQSMLTSSELERLSQSFIGTDFWIEQRLGDVRNLSEYLLTLVALGDPGLTRWHELLRPYNPSITQENSVTDKGMLTS